MKAILWSLSFGLGCQLPPGRNRSQLISPMGPMGPMRLMELPGGVFGGMGANWLLRPTQDIVLLPTVLIYFDVEMKRR